MTPDSNPQLRLRLNDRRAVDRVLRTKNAPAVAIPAQTWERVLGALRHAFHPATTPNDDLARVIKGFAGMAKVYVIGGAVRDVLLTVLLRQPRDSDDIDLVLETRLEMDDIAEVLTQTLASSPHPHVQTRTTLDGIRLRRLDEVPGDARGLDVWRIQDSYQVRHFSQPATIHAVVDHAGLNLSAIAYDIQDHLLIDGGCVSAILRREIDLTFPLYRRPAHLAKALELERRYGFTFSRTTWRRLRAFSVHSVIDEEVARYLRHHTDPQQAAELHARWMELKASFQEQPNDTDD